MTRIEWTDETWNPIVGCSIVSPGCTNCYAMRQAGRLLDKPGSHYAGTTQASNAGPVWTGKVALAPDHILTAPLTWKKPRQVFVNSMGDLFHEDAPDEWIDRVFAVMALCPQHTFQVLTKRPTRMRDYLRDVRRPYGIDNAGKALRGHYPPDGPTGWPLPNVWLGVSVEDQRRADERIPPLLETPAAVRFVSCEPLLGPVKMFGSFLEPCPVCADGSVPADERCDGATLDWVIVGGESGRGARPMHPDWARSLRDQCDVAGVPFFFKQWGAWAPGDPVGHIVVANGEIHDFQGEKWAGRGGQNGAIPLRRVGKAKAGRMLDGREHNDMPEMQRESA